MRYLDLTNAYHALGDTTKRLEKTRIVADFLQKTPVGELDTIILLLQGRVFARWDKRTLGISGRLAAKAVAQTVGVSEQQILRAWKKQGDLGLVAESLLKNTRQSTLFQQELTTNEVLTKLQSLQTIEGSGSVGKKLSTIQGLLASAEPESVKYLLGTILEELRVGVAEGVLRDAIVWAYLNPPVEDNQITNREEYDVLVKIVQAAYDRCSDYARVARAAKEGLDSLQAITFELGRPIRVMLAQRETSVESAFNRVGIPCALEFKYDGFRLQVHKDKNSVRLFTRRLEEVTTQFPDIVKAVQKGIKAETALLDCEAVGIDTTNNKYTAFQEISQRIRRKYGIEEMAKKLPVELCVFDVLYLEGEEILDKPFKKRRELLEELLPKPQEGVRLSECIITRDDNQGEEFYKRALAVGNEGLMAKNLLEPYTPGSRVGHMVKIKPTMDTLDLVVVGAEWGEGKRSGWLTSFTLACADSSGEEFLTVGKVGTGLKELESDDTLSFEQLTQALKDDIYREEGREVFTHPRVVLEIKFEEIQKSSSYDSGYALRFPRVIQLRDDRGPEDISTIDEVEAAFRVQRGR